MITHQPLFISLRQLVDNPSGKGSGFLAKRAMIKQGLNSTYIKILQRYRRHFMAVPYVYSDGRVLMHVKVPSEAYNINKIAYDVIFEFDGNSKNKLALRNIKAFSNSPSFIFTYAYVFNAKKIIVEQFKNRLPELCLTQAPEIRNPVESLGYEKSTYIAARYLLDSGALEMKYIEKYGKICNGLVEVDIRRQIANPDKLMEVYKHAQYLQRKTHRKEISETEKQKRNESSREFQRDQKRKEPNFGRNIFGVKVAPRPKITAKKAIKKIRSKKK